MFEGIFVTAHRRANQVAAPDPQNLRMVLRRIDIIEGEFELALLELLGDPVRYLLVGVASCRPRLLEDLYGVFLVDLRLER